MKKLLFIFVLFTTLLTQAQNNVVTSTGDKVDLTSALGGKADTGSLIKTSFAGLANGDQLRWNSSTSRFENFTPTSSFPNTAKTLYNGFGSFVSNNGDSIVPGTINLFSQFANYGSNIGYMGGNVGLGLAVPTERLVIRGTSINEGPVMSAEFLSNTWTATSGWSGSGLTYTHAASGGVTTLTEGTAAVSGTKYQITYTVTGRTAGTFDISFGGISIAALSTSGAFGPTATSTASLVVTPTTTFDGTITFSIKSLTAPSTPMLSFRGADSLVKMEFRINSPQAAAGMVALGPSSLGYVTTGVRLSAVGYQALRYNTTGSDNNAQGNLALTANTTGSFLVAVGTQALVANISGDRSVAVGYRALFTNTTGVGSVAVGYLALNLSNANSNVGVGTQALTAATGASNTGLGNTAGSANTTGTFNTYLGNATTGLISGTNMTSLGNGANSLTSNNMQYGNTSIVSHTFAAGKFVRDATMTTAGTTGNQTINKPTGSVNIAAAGTTITVTNSYCTATSIVIPVLRTNDATAWIKSVVPAAGSFVITLGAAATAEVSIGFEVMN